MVSDHLLTERVWDPKKPQGREIKVLGCPNGLQRGFGKVAQEKGQSHVQFFMTFQLSMFFRIIMSHCANKLPCAFAWSPLLFLWASHLLGDSEQPNSKQL